MMPVQEPVLTAHTKVFSSPAAAVPVFSTLVAIAAPFLVLKASPIHASTRVGRQAKSSDRLQAGGGRAEQSVKRGAHKHQRYAKQPKTVAAVLSATPA